MSIETPPTAPSRSQVAATFNTNVEAYLAWLEEDFIPGVNALAAAGAFDADLWVSGTTYAIGDLTWSPIDYAVYRRITNGAGTTDPSADATNWAAVISVPTSTVPRLLENAGFSVTMAANAVTIALTGANGSAPSSSNKVGTGFRSATIASGDSSKVQSIAASSTVISSGSTGGSVSAIKSQIWVAEILVSGAKEIAWMNPKASTGGITNIDEGALISTTAEGGAGAADSAGVWYSTTARSNVPFTVLGYFESTQATAGTWVTAPSTVVVNPKHRPGDVRHGMFAPVATTSGASKDFTGFPEGTFRITVMPNGVSVSGTSLMLIQIGDAGGIEATGYISQGVTGGGTAASSTAGFLMDAEGSAGYAFHGAMVLELIDASTNTWSCTNSVGEAVSVHHISAGRKALSDVLTQLRFTCVNGTDTGDAGTLGVSFDWRP
jgi:hypothetical protein